MAMEIAPIGLRQANEFVAKLHRHHKPVPGCKFAVGILDDAGKIRGVAIAGRPVSRMLDDGYTSEINRCCTDGVPNGCSKLYRACWDIAFAMGYTRLITYTLPKEGGSSLRGCGFVFMGERGGGEWSRAKRPRKDKHPTETKWLWQLGWAKPKSNHSEQ